MRYRRLDANGDYVFGGGYNDFYTDLFAVAQALKTRLFLFLGEWWENLQDGTPMFESILGASGNNKAAIDLILQQRILAVPNVSGIVEIKSSLVNREYSFYAVVSTIFGKLTISNIPNTSGKSKSGALVLISEDSGFILTDDSGNIILTT